MLIVYYTPEFLSLMKMWLISCINWLTWKIQYSVLNMKSILINICWTEITWITNWSRFHWPIVGNNENPYIWRISFESFYSLSLILTWQLQATEDKIVIWSLWGMLSVCTSNLVKQSSNNFNDLIHYTKLKDKIGQNYQKVWY